MLSVVKPLAVEAFTVSLLRLVRFPVVAEVSLPIVRVLVSFLSSVLIPKSMSPVVRVPKLPIFIVSLPSYMKISPAIEMLL